MLIFTLGVGNVWGQATLPTSYDGGKSNLPTGYSQDGLDSDYGSSPKLKFNGAGDYFQVYFSTAPAYVTYKIKQNGTASSLSFIVEESANGSTWTTVESYNAWGNGTTKTETKTLLSTTRYVKWRYVTKGSSTNIGLGAISVKARTSVTLDKNGGTSDGSVVVAYNATAKDGTLTEPVYSGYAVTGYWEGASTGNKVLNADGTFAANNVSGWITSGKWSKDAATAKLYARWEATGCSNYSFHYGATPNGDGKNITDQTVECFSQVGSTTEWQLADFTIPTTTQYYFVGYAGYFYDSNIGPSGASNSGSERNQFKYLPVANLQGSSCGGTGDAYKHAAAGAHGKIRIYSDNSGKNIYAGFVPSGYQMRYGTEGQSDWANIQLTQEGTSAVWKSGVMDMTAAVIAKRYYVNVWTSGSYSSSDDGVAINNWTNGDNVISSMRRKTNSGDNWADGVTAGMRGYFRVWTDNCANNGYTHFVPTHRIVYHSNYPGGGGPADTYSVDVSVEETNSSIALASAPTAPTGYTFDGWYTAASGGTKRTGNQTISAGASADVELYAHWTETLHDVTVAYKCGATTLQSSTTIENVGIVTTGTTTAPASFTGYTWSTWSAMPSGVTTSTTPLTNRTIVINATADSKTITANYTANQYDITYKDQGGGAFSGTQTSAPTKHTYGTATTLKIPTKVGYDFGGWYTSSDCSTGAVGTSVSASLGATDYTNNIVLYAKWTLHDYTISSSLTNCTASPSIPNSYTYTGSAAGLSYTISPSSDMYGLPSTISVSGVSYTWAPATGVLTLTGTISSNVSITIAAQPKVIWMAGGQVFNTQQGASGTTLSNPGTPSSATYCDGSKTFVGWSASTISGTTNTEPSDLFSSSEATSLTIPSGGTTYYAVYATVTGTYGKFKRVTGSSVSTDVVAGNKIAIVYYNTNNLCGINAAGTAFAAGTATTEDASGKITKPSTNNIWTISKSGSYFIFTNAKHTSKKIATNSTASPTVLNISTQTYYQFELGANSGATNHFYLRIYDTSSSSITQRALQYYNSKWQIFGNDANYASNTNRALKLYVPDYTATEFATTCAEMYDVTRAGSPAGTVTGGTFTVSPTSQSAGRTVTLSATPNIGYMFDGWTVTKTASPYTDITSTNVEGNTLTMPAYAVTVSAAFSAISSIAVKTAPTKTTYCQGECFDPTGLVITATYANSETEDIPYSGNTEKFTFSPTLSTGLAPSNTSVSITYAAKSTSQAITVNVSRTVTLTGGGSTTGGTFSADNSTACVGATITLTATPSTHYSLGSWTVTKAGGGTVEVTSNQFTMPDENVTVNATFAEDEYKTVVFQNNGINMYTGAGYDATNNWKQKVYVGDSPAKPTDLTDGYGSGDACNATSTLFYGWTKETWDNEIEEKSTLDARTGNQKVYGKSAALPAVTAEDPNTIIYHAVWADGEAVTPTLPTTIVAWEKMSLTASVGASATTGSGTMTSSVSLSTNSTRTYQGSASASTTITLTGLNLSSYSNIRLSFWARGSAGGTISVKSNLSETPLATTAEITTGAPEVQYIVDNIPNTATSITLTYSASTGSFFFGTVKLVTHNSTAYTFTELTSSNTSGWSETDWDGYYLITNSQETLKALDGNAIGEKSYVGVTASEGKISSPISTAFQIAYNLTEEKYTVKGIGDGVYLATGSNSVGYVYEPGNTSYHSTVAYNQINNSNSSVLTWNNSGTKFGFYSSKQTAWPTLYKILSSYSTFRTTCCDKNITLSNPTITDAASSGATITFDKSSLVATCGGETTVTATLTLPAGYQATALSFSGGSVSVSPEITLPVTTTTEYTLTFAQNTNATLTTTATIAAKPLGSIILAESAVEIYDQQYVQIGVTYDPADILTKGYTLVSGPTKVVTTGSTQTQLKISATKSGVVISEEVKETVSIKANADNTKTASVVVTIKPLPRVHFTDIIHNVVFGDVVEEIVGNVLSGAKTTPTHSDVSEPGENYNSCERGHLHLLGWIESTWADAHPGATSGEITGAGSGIYYEAGASINIEVQNGKTFYAVWCIVE